MCTYFKRDKNLINLNGLFQKSKIELINLIYLCF